MSYGVTVMSPASTLDLFERRDAEFDVVAGTQGARRLPDAHRAESRPGR
jgi:hypothetical protein